MSFNGDLNASDDGLELTTKGQIHTYSTENTALNLGTDGYILSADSTEGTGLKYIANSDAGLTLGSKGDIHTRSASDQAALAVGANLKSLYANSAETTGLQWNTNARETLTAAGDILYASGANTLAKLAKGSDTDVLTLASGLPSWAAAAGGGTSLLLVCGDETTAISSIGQKFSYRQPEAMTLNAGIAGIKGSLVTAGTGADLLTVDIRDANNASSSTIEAGATADSNAATTYITYKQITGLSAGDK